MSTLALPLTSDAKDEASKAVSLQKRGWIERRKIIPTVAGETKVRSK